MEGRPVLCDSTTSFDGDGFSKRNCTLDSISGRYARALVNPGLGFSEVTRPMTIENPHPVLYKATSARKHVSPPSPSRCGASFKIVHLTTPGPPFTRLSD